MIDLLVEPSRHFGRYIYGPFGYRGLSEDYQPRLFTRERYENRAVRRNGYRPRECDSTGWRDVPIEVCTQSDNQDTPFHDDSTDSLSSADSESCNGDEGITCLSDPWVSSIFLTLKDRDELENDSLLSDKHIFAAQKLLQRQFPNTRGLQDSCLSQTTFQPIQFDVDSPGGAVVQIHHTRGNHWVVSACVDGQVLVYDSLYKNLAPDLVKQLKEVYRSCILQDRESELKVIMPTVKPQTGGKDCGLFSVAYAYELCCGRDPCELHFDQKQMRKHLKSCFSKEELSRFPIITFLKRDKSKDNVVYV